MKKRITKPLNSDRSVIIRESSYYKSELTASDFEVMPHMGKKSDLWSDFAQNKTAIINELRTLVVHDSTMKKFMTTGNVNDLNQTQISQKNHRRKWDLFLKYADVWDDDLKNLALLEFKKIYAVAQYSR